jgi:lipoate-protein ligase A
MPDVRLYPFDSRSGPATLAADEVLLDLASAGIASLRFYLWGRPTLSLGYFQPAADRFLDPRLAELPFVRRSSGGAAIVHGDGDLTYCLALPAGKPWQCGESWLCRFHHLLEAVFRTWSVPARAVACGEEKKAGPVLCFLHQTPADLVVDGSKVVGSAQRKLKGALMQHGSIRLRTSRFAPELPGLRELAGADVSAEALAAAAVARFLEVTGWELLPTDWTGEDERRIERIVSERYGNPEWNEKR